MAVELPSGVPDGSPLKGMSTPALLSENACSAYQGGVTEDQERWAEAVAIRRMHGDGAAVWVAARIGVFALARDRQGVTRFTAIATRLDHLLRPGSVH